MKIKQINISDLDKILVVMEYKLDDNIKFELYKQSDDKWCVFTDHRFCDSENKFKIFGDEKFGGLFNSLYDAQTELVRICQFYITPMKNKHIKKHFSMRWMKKEEQSEELIRFRTALLNGHWKRAANIYNNQLSHWTKEAIPNIVTFQISRNLKK
jgi:hypothetical protein